MWGRRWYIFLCFLFFCNNVFLSRVWTTGAGVENSLNTHCGQDVAVASRESKIPLSVGLSVRYFMHTNLDLNQLRHVESDQSLSALLALRMDVVQVRLVSSHFASSKKAPRAELFT